MTEEMAQSVRVTLSKLVEKELLEVKPERQKRTLN